MHFHSLLSLTWCGALLLQCSSAAVINHDSASAAETPWKGSGHINIVKDGKDVGCMDFHGYFADHTGSERAVKCQPFVPDYKALKHGKFRLGFPNRGTRFASMSAVDNTMFCGHMAYASAWTWKAEGAHLINPNHSGSNNSITTWYLNDGSDQIGSYPGDYNVYLRWEGLD